MKLLLITNLGIEDIAAAEVEAITGKKADLGKGYITIEGEYEDALALVYKAQSLGKVLIHIDGFNFTNKILEEVKGKITKDVLSKLFDKQATFSVETIKQNFPLDVATPEFIDVISTDIQKDFGWVGEYKNPSVLFQVYLTEKECHLGIDICPKDLDKRAYKIFQAQPPLKASLAFALFKFSQYSKGTLVDPLCGAGLIPIEAALNKTNLPVNFYEKAKLRFPPLKGFPDQQAVFEKIDKKIKKSSSKEDQIFAVSSSFQHINAAKKNAKIAGVNSSIEFSRQDLDWLELKFDEANVDTIATMPLQYSQRSNMQRVEQFYDELFKQAQFILKPKGTFAILSRKRELIDKYAEFYKFKVEEERHVWQGKEQLFMVRFRK